MEEHSNGRERETSTLPWHAGRLIGACDHGCTRRYGVDSLELFVDLGSGTPGIGPGKAWQRVTPGNAVFNAATPADLTSLVDAQIGDIALVVSNNTTYILKSYGPSVGADWVAIGASSSAPPAGYTDVQWQAAATVHEFVTYIDASGVQHLAQPSFADISGQLSQTQLPTSIGVGSALTAVDCGTF